MSKINNSHIFVDCEVFLNNAQNKKELFVETEAYELCKNLVKKRRILMLLGNPGTGKTTTTQMLALYYASEDYIIRYIDSSESIKDLKATISANKNRKELIILDDCFGQTYFNLQENQCKELVSLFSYVKSLKNKYLIMNSRIVVYNEAKNKNLQLKDYFDDRDIESYVINMDNLTTEDKGMILYNHLFYKGMPNSLIKEITKDKRYRKIVKHINYNPRIIEYITKKSFYKDIETGNYFEKVLDKLNNPSDIWCDEFTRNLKPENRILLTTLYSLSDTYIDETTLKRAYYNRIKFTSGLDTTIDLYEKSKGILGESFIKTTIFKDKLCIGVLNPSINDFLRKHIQDDQVERDNISRYVTEYSQVNRGFGDTILQKIEDCSCLNINYSSNIEKYSVLLGNICKNNIFINDYQKLINDFLIEYPYIGYNFEFSRVYILAVLCEEEFVKFYNIPDKMIENALSKLSDSKNYEEYKELINLLKHKRNNYIYTNHQTLLIEGIDLSIDQYLKEIETNPYSYYEEWDIQKCINSTIKSIEETPDIEKAANNLINKIEEKVYDDIENELQDLPDAIYELINHDYQIYVDYDVIYDAIREYMENDDDKEDSNNDAISDDYLLDSIFAIE